MKPAQKNNAASRHRQRRRGQALVEFIIIYPTLLLLVLGAFQFALIYQAKSTLNYATFMAARQGALKNAKTNPMKDALAAGMTPLFMSKKDDYLDLVKARAIAAIEAFNPLNTQIRVLNPTADAYNAHKADSESGTEIPNDNLMYRPTTAKGGMSVQDANLLTIEVTYCTRLIVPIVNRVIYSLYFGFVGEKVLAAEYYSEAATPAGLAGQRCADINDQIDSLLTQLASYVPGGSGFLSSFSFPEIPTTIPGIDWNVGGYRIPITSKATVRMQSPVTQAP
ncbi:MAG: pilus assembly protein [Burkholderiales bacterium]|nr:pilus assembly protein [Burkholderiales bacterium]MDP2399609.1 pilus assembly protein [Burkholderiales bacterium]